MAMSPAQRKKKAEQKREQAKELQAGIADQVEALRSTDEWVRYLEFVKGFHRYSMNNLMLIKMQCPHATYVAGFRAWQKKGREVRKNAGEKSIKIFGYSIRKASKDDEDNPDATLKADGNAAVRVFYPIVHVFDISQTVPLDGSEDTGPVPHPTQQLVGEDPLGVVDVIAAWLRGMGWKFSIQPTGDASDGYTSPAKRIVVIDDSLSPAAQAKVALHEAAHVILHVDQEGVDYAAHRGVCETEAESVAYVVAGLLGLDTSTYSIGYITGWSDGDAAMIKSTAANVLRAVHVIAEQFEHDDDEVAEPAA